VVGVTTTAKAPFAQESAPDGRFTRQRNRFTDRISRDSTSAPGAGPDGEGRWPVEAGRYRLVVSLACPWAHRSVVDRELLGLTDAISLGVVDPIRDDRGWRFTLDDGGVDPVLGDGFLSETYLRADSSYTQRVTVPAIVDTLSGEVVTNDYPQISLDLSTEWRDFQGPGAPDLLPAEQRSEMDVLMDEVFHDVNNGVYKCGFATSQEAYEAAYAALWSRLDLLEERLGERRFLMGDAVTEADVRLFTTLVRFDAVYHGHFKCNRNKITEMPALWRYARELFALPGFGETVDFDQIKRHYYVTHPTINPTGIVPVGPDASVWTR